MLNKISTLSLNTITQRNKLFIFYLQILVLVHVYQLKFLTKYFVQLFVL